MVCGCQTDRNAWRKRNSVIPVAAHNPRILNTVQNCYVGPKGHYHQRAMSGMEPAQCRDIEVVIVIMAQQDCVNFRQTGQSLFRARSHALAQKNAAGLARAGPDRVGQ